MRTRAEVHAFGGSLHLLVALEFGRDVVLQFFSVLLEQAEQRMSLVLVAAHVHFFFVFDFIDLLVVLVLLLFGAELLFAGLAFFVVECVFRLLFVFVASFLVFLALAFFLFELLAGLLFDKDLGVDFVESKDRLNWAANFVECPEEINFGRFDK